MTTHRRIARAAISEPISDNEDRNIMAMSTLIASDQWLIETSWDGKAIGDLQVFKNRACGPNGLRLLNEQPKDKEGKALRDEEGKPIQPTPKPDDWVWWGGIPCGKVKWYRFVAEEPIVPMTLKKPEDEILPFNLPSHGQSEKESRKPGATRGS